jgi:hypothetical protein
MERSKENGCGKLRRIGNLVAVGALMERQQWGKDTKTETHLLLIITCNNASDCYGPVDTLLLQPENFAHTPPSRRLKGEYQIFVNPLTCSMFIMLKK